MKKPFFITMLVLLGAQLHCAVAEGTLTGAVYKEYGVNRRVLTSPSGFTGVKAVFSGPGGSLLPSPHILPTSIYKPGPTFYLGAKRKDINGDPWEFDINGANVANDVEVDAGFQWEPKPFTRKTGNRPDGSPIYTTYPPGWSVFVTSSTGAGQASVSANGWRCGLGTNNPNVTSVEMSWVFFRRSTPSVGPKYGGYLYVNAVGARTQPAGADLGSNKFLAQVPGSTPDALTGDLLGMSCKRVEGITQNDLGLLPLPTPLTGGVYDEDGTTFTGLIFSGGQVTQANPLVGPFGPSYSPVGWTTWTDTNTALNAGKTPGGTGFFPGGKDLTLRVARLSGGLTFVETPINQSTPASRDIFRFNAEPDREAPRPGRYANEDMDVSLRRSVAIGGGFVNPS